MNDRGGGPDEPPADTAVTHIPADTDRPRRGRRLLRVVITALLAVSVAATATSIVVAVQNTRSARDWKTRATTADTDLHELQERHRELSDRVDDATGTIAALQDRTIALADEKARAGDRAVLADVDGATAAGVADRLDTCTAGLVEVFAAISRARTQAEIDSVATDFEAIAAVCDEAAGGARGLADFLVGDHG